MSWFPLAVVNLIERLRKFALFRGVYDRPPMVMPIVQLNDDVADIINSFSAERTATGSSTITTTQSGRNDTFISSLTLTISEGITA